VALAAVGRASASPGPPSGAHPAGLAAAPRSRTPSPPPVLAAPLAAPQLVASLAAGSRSVFAAHCQDPQAAGARQLLPTVHPLSLPVAAAALVAALPCAVVPEATSCPRGPSPRAARLPAEQSHASWLRSRGSISPPRAVRTSSAPVDAPSAFQPALGAGCPLRSLCHATPAAASSSVVDTRLRQAPISVRGAIPVSSPQPIAALGACARGDPRQERARSPACRPVPAQPAESCGAWPASGHARDAERGRSGGGARGGGLGVAAAAAILGAPGASGGGSPDGHGAADLLPSLGARHPLDASASAASAPTRTPGSPVSSAAACSDAEPGAWAPPPPRTKSAPRCSVPCRLRQLKLDAADPYDGILLTPMNDRPFQEIASIARQAHNALVERIRPR